MSPWAQDVAFQRALFRRPSRWHGVLMSSPAAVLVLGAILLVLLA